MFPEIGISTFALTWAFGVPGHAHGRMLTGKDLIDIASDAGIHRVQFGDNYALDALSDSELCDLATYAESLGVAVEVGTRGLIYDNMIRYLEIARIFRSPFVRVVIDKGGYTPDSNEIIEVINRLLPAYETESVSIGIENHDRFTCSELIGILDEVGRSSVGICLDTVNSFGAMENPWTVIDSLAQYALNVHVKDFRISRPFHNMGFLVEGTPAGEGFLDIRYLLDNPHIQKNKPSFILESWVTPGKSMDETLDKERRWLDKGISFLKSIQKEDSSQN